MTPRELKNSILQLAIQGKLVEQRPEEGTAEELYRQIQREKQALIKAGKIKKEKPLPEITEDEVPFEIPEGWKWVRLASITTLNPKNDLPDDLETGFIPMPCVSDGYRNEHTFEVKKWGEIKKGFTHFADRDIGIAKITPCFQNRKSVVFNDLPNGHGAGTTELSIVRVVEDTLSREFLLWFFKSEYFISNGKKSFTGTAGQQRIHKDYLSFCVFPLPPLAEQKRIVAKIEELLPLIERYETAWSRLEDFNKRFPVDMQKSLLQMAIQGKLVEQRPEEGTGEELNKQIQAEKQALIKAGKIKKEKPLPEISEDEIPFEIPESWKWVRLGEIITDVKDGPHFSPPYQQKGIPFVSTRNVSSGKLDLSTAKYISKELHEELCKRVKPKKWDVLYTKGGTTGIAAVNDSDIEFSVWVHVAVLSLGALIYPYYLAMTLNSPHCYEQSQAYTHGTSNRDLGLTRMVKITLPLPPLAEQKRIVARLEELLPLCERLK